MFKKNDRQSFNRNDCFYPMTTTTKSTLSIDEDIRSALSKLKSPPNKPKRQIKAEDGSRKFKGLTQEQLELAVQ